MLRKRGDFMLMAEPERFFASGVAQLDGGLGPDDGKVRKGNVMLFRIGGLCLHSLYEARAKRFFG